MHILRLMLLNCELKNVLFMVEWSNVDFRMVEGRFRRSKVHWEVECKSIYVCVQIRPMLMVEPAHSTKLFGRMCRSI